MALITCYKPENKRLLNCSGVFYEEETRLHPDNPQFWIAIAVYAGLVIFAGIMSGLTLGLLSLDITSLNVLKEAGTATQQKYVKRILPLVKRHHLLLVTLLLSNAAAVETMPICLNLVANEVVSIVVSVTAVLIFGEVLPQALCARYGLAIGANLSPLVYFLMVVLFIIAWPIAKILDFLLGQEHGTFFRRAELKALVDLHEQQGHPGEGAGAEEPLSPDEVLIIKGALELRGKTVVDAMVPLESVFMLEESQLLDEELRNKLISESYSRVPVYSEFPDKIVGLLLTKTLIGISSDKNVTVSSLLGNTRYCRPVHFVTDSANLYEVLAEFKSGRTHMSVVRRSFSDFEISASQAQENIVAVEPMDPANADIIGIITLEDILEELLQGEIIDETDVYVDVHQRVRVNRPRSQAVRARLSVSSQLSAKHNSTKKLIYKRKTYSYGSTFKRKDYDKTRSKLSETSPLLNDIKENT